MKKNYFKSLLASVLATVLVLTNSLCVLADTSVSDGNAGISIASVSDNNAGIATVSTGDATENSYGIYRQSVNYQKLRLISL